MNSCVFAFHLYGEQRDTECIKLFHDQTNTFETNAFETGCVVRGNLCTSHQGRCLSFESTDTHTFLNGTGTIRTEFKR